jgi:hypothetical protein
VHLLLFHEQLQKKLVKAGVGVPVDAAQVVAQGVFPKVREFCGIAQGF